MPLYIANGVQPPPARITTLNSASTYILQKDGHSDSTLWAYIASKLLLTEDAPSYKAYGLVLLPLDFCRTNVGGIPA